MTNVQRAKNAILKGGALYHFMSKGQRQVLQGFLRGEEANHFSDVILQTVEVVEKMPTTYQTDGQGGEAIVHLHYFKGNTDAWIIEKDRGDPLEPDDKRQHQAFGKVSMHGNELSYGYVSLEELIFNGVELDLYWTPIPVKSIGKD